MTNTVENMRLSNFSEECRLNSLPDTIRNRIVSFLPPEEAVKASVLSRQWRHVYCSLSDLNFDQRKYCPNLMTPFNRFGEMRNRKPKGGKIGFRSIVDNLLLQHDTSSIRSFTLSSSLDNASDRNSASDNVLIEDHRINAWVSFAVRHNVQHLHLRILQPVSQDHLLRILSSNSKQLPWCVFTCSTLQELSLDNIKVDLPYAINLPNLKRLAFFNVKFEGTNFSRKLLSNCPILEDLVLQNCCVSSSTITITAPTLVKLTLHGFSNKMLGFSIKIEVCAPKLQVLKCLASCLGDVSSETLSSLIFAEFDDFSSWPEFSMTKILLGLTNVKTLRISRSASRVLQKILNSLPCSPTIF